TRRRTITDRSFEALYAFVRDNTKTMTDDQPPASDVQTALTVIGRRKKIGEGVPDLRSAHIPKANLNGADLRDAELRGADLRGVDLTDAMSAYANLSNTDLSGANLSGANLRDANLSGADLSGANLGSTGILDVIIDNGGSGIMHNGAD